MTGLCAVFEVCGVEGGEEEGREDSPLQVPSVADQSGRPQYVHLQHCVSDSQIVNNPGHKGESTCITVSFSSSRAGWMVLNAPDK